MNENTLEALQQVLALNPKPAYQKDATKVYGLNYGHFNIKFQLDEDNVYILSLQHQSNE